MVLTGDCFSGVGSFCEVDGSAVSANAASAKAFCLP